MILQKQRAREYKGKTIYKYVIVIPPDDVEALGWKEGQELNGIVIKDKGYLLS
jgi:bifunctional DNA-binding transcriptional regulator/antitoxin component of YhaV-PrlF toxin-antitoxin module